MSLPEPWERKGRGWYVEHPLINGGKQTKLGNTREEADAKLLKLLRDRGAIQSPTTVGELLKEYWDWYTATSKFSTWDTRKDVYKSLCAYFPPDIPAESLRPCHAEQWAKQCHPKAIAPGGKNRVLGFIKQIWRWGKQYGYLQNNTLETLRVPSDGIRQDFIPPNLFTKVMKFATNQEVKDVITFVLDCGARAEELPYLTAETFHETCFSLPIVDSKKQQRSRVIHLPETSRAIAKRLVAEYPEGPIFRSSKRRKGQWGGGKGKPWDKDSLSNELRKIRDKINETLPKTQQIKSLCITVLRHSFSHYRVSQGQDINLVAALMGHVDTKMVMRRYGHIDQGDILRNAANEIQLPQHKSKKKKGDDDKAA